MRAGGNSTDGSPPRLLRHSLGFRTRAASCSPSAALNSGRLESTAALKSAAIRRIFCKHNNEGW